MNPFNVQNTPMTYFMNILKQARNLRNDPSQVASLLLDNGVIDQNTFQQIRGKSPSQIGEYLMNNGLMNQQQAQELYKNVPMLQEML